jgi:hypothetical protein
MHGGFMKTDLTIVKWNDALINKAGPVSIDAEDLKAVLSRIKALEIALADQLRLWHAGKEQLGA